MFKETLAAIERVLHRRSRTPSMEAIVPPGGRLDETQDYARLSKMYFREPVQFTTEGRQILHGLTSSDLDLEKGGLKPNYMATREVMARAEAFEKTRPKEVYLLGNLNPK